MKDTLLVLIGLVVALSCAKVYKLNKSNFESELDKSAKAIVLFYAPWCQHCKQFEPVFKAASKSLGKKVTFAKVDCQDNAEICQAQKVEGYPTVKFFEGGASGKVSPFKGARTEKGIEEFLDKMSSPAYVDIKTVEAYNTFIQGDLVVVGFFPEEAQRKVFTDVAEQMRFETSFGLVSDAEVIKAIESVKKVPSVVVHRASEKEDIVYDGEMVVEDVTKFVNQETVPLVYDVSNLTQEKFNALVDRGLQFGYVFINDAEKDASLLAEVRKAAKALRGRLLYLMLEGSRYAGASKSLGLAEGTSGVVIRNKEQKNFNYPLDKEYTAEGLIEHANNFLEGKLTPNMRSQPIPAKQEDVVMIVGKTFESVVRDPTKDVLVKFYAPWCGHCKQLVPTYEKLAQTLKSEKDVVIGEIDATENDVDGVDIKGFPTLYFFPKNAKTKPIEYSGDRSYDDLLKFVQKNRSGAPAAASAEKEDL